MHLYSLLLDDSAFIKVHPRFSAELLLELIQKVMRKGEDNSLHEAAVHELNRLQYDHIPLLAPHFDTLLGYFSQLAEDHTTFAWYKEEIQTKKPEKISTFNPLQGLDFWEVQRKENAMANEMRYIKDILQEILQMNEKVYVATVTQVLGQLDSKTHAKYKTELLNLTATSLQDPLLIASQLPALYNYLFDVNSVQVRMEGLKFLERLIKNFPDLVTQTLLDLATLFLTDPEVGVRGQALALQSAIARSFPEKITAATINTILHLMVDRFVFVHTRAAKACVDFIPFMTKNDLLEAVSHLRSLEEIHKEKDPRFSQELIRNMLQLTEEVLPLLQKRIIKEYVLLYARSSDYYTSTDFIKLLGNLKKQHAEFEDDWLQLVVNWFRKVAPDVLSSDLDERSSFYKQAYNLSYACIKRNITLLETFLQERNERQIIDVIQILHLLSYFECHQSVVRYVNLLPTSIQRVRLTEWFFKQAELLRHFSQFEEGVKNGNYYQNELKEIAYVLQKATS